MHKIVIPQVKARGIFLWWGKLRFMYGHATFYVGVLQLILVAMMAYNTTVRDWAFQYLGLEIAFWQYVLALTALIGLGFVLEYTVSIPALIAVSNEQMYKHQSPIKDDFEELKQKQGELEAKLDEVLKLLRKE